MGTTRKVKAEYTESKPLHAAEKQQLENDALRIINERLGTRYSSLREVSIEKIVKSFPC